ncbi:MAG: HIT family protein [Chloroflexi bacterium]|jgi:ATP adenylyltransferase|nr:MAG: HIT family protein [Chloroflexota bacterium]TMG07967.1 MAG: HIT family protein [Chloroflexota bacterium]
MSCELCDPAGSDLASFACWRIFAARDQNYLGKCIIALRRHEEDFLALTEAERDEMWEAARAVRDALARRFAPDHFNYQVLGNSGRHVHMHLTPRYTSPREFGGITFTDDHWGTWPFPSEQALPEGFLKTLADAISRVMPPKGAAK